jgi:cysteine desulfurase/selenocysteine lyase
VAAPIASPSVPDPMDMGAMTLLITRMANELFSGGPVPAVPSPQGIAAGGALPVPSGPGYSTEVPLLGANAPSQPPASTTPTLYQPTPPPAGLDPELLNAGSEPVESVTTLSPSSLPLMSTTLPQATPVTPAPPAGAPAPPAGAPASPAPAQLSRAAPPAPPAPSAPSAPSQPPRAVPALPGLTGLAGFADVESAAFSPQTPNPFGPTSLDSFDPAGFTKPLFLPMLESGSFDVAPLFLPPEDATSVDHPPRLELLSSYELQQPAIRELGGGAFDPYATRRDFPILEERVHGKRLIWLDNAATTQKPRAVIDRISSFYEHENSNIHRAAHTLAARATDAYETGREVTRRFLNAPSTHDIIFVRGATEGINLIAQSWGRRNIQSGDEIVLTHLEHHANIVPWQMLCAETGARLRVAPVDDRGDLILEEYERLLGPRTRLVAFPQVSNALGTITPAREMVEMAHRRGATVLVDGAQAVSHMRVDVQALDCDFYVFSGHKVFAPTGIGVVYGKRDVLAQMPPWQGGGNMIADVTFERTTYQPPPMRFEAGTGNIADAAGLGAALEYVMRIGMDVIDRYEHELLVYATERLRAVRGLRVIGTSSSKAGVLSFILDGYRNEDVGAALDREGIAVRSGHHCAQPILRRFGLEGSVRASLAFYNVIEDIDALVATLMRLAAER